MWTDKDHRERRIGRREVGSAWAWFIFVLIGGLGWSGLFLSGNRRARAARVKNSTSVETSERPLPSSPIAGREKSSSARKSWVGALEPRDFGVRSAQRVYPAQKILKCPRLRGSFGRVCRCPRGFASAVGSFF
jgi:hypothetical protein